MCSMHKVAHSQRFFFPHSWDFHCALDLPNINQPRPGFSWLLECGIEEVTALEDCGIKIGSAGELISTPDFPSPYTR